MKDSFSTLKRLLTSSPVLYAPDFQRSFHLQTDASNLGLGAILCQPDDDGVEHPVTFLSRQLLPRKHNYSTIEKNVSPLSGVFSSFTATWPALHYSPWRTINLLLGSNNVNIYHRGSHGGVLPCNPTFSPLNIAEDC